MVHVMPKLSYLESNHRTETQDWANKLDKFLASIEASMYRKNIWMSHAQNKHYYTMQWLPMLYAGNIVTQQKKRWFLQVNMPKVIRYCDYNWYILLIIIDRAHVAHDMSARLTSYIREYSSLVIVNILFWSKIVCAKFISLHTMHALKFLAIMMRKLTSSIKPNKHSWLSAGSVSGIIWH